MAITLPVVIVPSAVVAFGFPKGSRIMRAVAALGLITAIGGSAITLVRGSDAWAYVAAAVLFATLLAIVTRPGYVAFALFKRRLRVRRIELRRGH